MADVIENPFSKVFERWGESMEKIVGDNYSQEKSSTIAKAPYARMFLMGNPGMRWDLEGNECSTTLAVQCESFADGTKAIQKAYSIDTASHKAMTDMGFRRSFGPELVDNAEAKIKRVISRYTMAYTGYFKGELSE